MYNVCCAICKSSQNLWNFAAPFLPLSTDQGHCYAATRHRRHRNRLQTPVVITRWKYHNCERRQWIYQVPLLESLNVKCKHNFETWSSMIGFSISRTAGRQIFSPDALFAVVSFCWSFVPDIEHVCLAALYQHNMKLINTCTQRTYTLKKW